MNRIGRSASFGVAAAAALAVAFDSFSETFNSAWVAVSIASLLMLHAIRFGRVVFPREALFYACFLGYMLVELLWTRDRALAMNTLLPAANFVLVLVLFASLAVTHDLKAVIAGTVAGFLVGALVYARMSGFPFQYPAGFSYNAIAGMYLFGLTATLLLASIAERKWPFLVLAAIVGIHVVATTSIKTNLGIALGALAVGFAHFRDVTRLLWRHAAAIAAVVVVLAYAIANNESAVETIGRGADRVMLGVEILQARENLPGYSSFERRENWQREGFRGWLVNPVFGHGVEAFRARFGITSHASHVDILYNSGLIGMALFYGIFVSMFLRLYRARDAGFRYARMVIFGGTVCSMFISFAGTIHYGANLAAFLALGIGILKRA